MERRTKIILLIAGGVLIVGSISVGLYLHFRNKDKEDNEQDEQGTSPIAPPKVNETQTANETTSETTPKGDGLTRPTFNVENELSNSLTTIKGHYLYPKRKEQGGWGHTNVRSSAMVNNDQGWWDPSDNLITTINSGTVIGKVIGEEAGVYNDYSYRWFKVKLTKPTGGIFSPYTEGYVRGDTVTFKPF